MQLSTAQGWPELASSDAPASSMLPRLLRCTSASVKCGRRHCEQARHPTLALARLPTAPDSQLSCALRMSANEALALRGPA